MKKFLVIALIAVSFTACNNGKKDETSSSTVDSSTIVTADTTTKMATPDTTTKMATPDTMSKMTTTTTKDTTNKK